MQKQCTVVQYYISNGMDETIMISNERSDIVANTNITMRIDENLKAQLQELLSNLGMDMTIFFTLAAKQAVREQAWWRLRCLVRIIPDREQRELTEYRRTAL